MGCTQDHIGCFGVSGHDLRQCFNHVLYAFMATEQTEGQQDFSSLHTEFVFVVIGVDERYIVNTVGDVRNFVVGYPTTSFSDSEAISQSSSFWMGRGSLRTV